MRSVLVAIAVLTHTAHADGVYYSQTIGVGQSSVFGRPLQTRAALGATPYFAAFFAFVNIHHYFMDHVIWRRENPETRHLRG